MSKKKIILGIDPGTRITGYGIVEVEGRNYKVLDYGCIRPPVKAKLSDRYFIIFESLAELFELYTPTEMAIETQFVYKNAQSALKLGIAQGVAILQAKKNNIKIFGYSPREVKCAICGTGRAGKEQVQGAISRAFCLKSYPEPQDAADALAIALCHGEVSQNILSFKLTQKEL